MVGRDEGDEGVLSEGFRVVEGGDDYVECMSFVREMN